MLHHDRGPTGHLAAAPARLVTSTRGARAGTRAGALGSSLLALVALASTAGASPADRFGLGPRGVALGGAFTALATDWSATYYNPAGLVFVDGAEVSLGFSYAGYELDYDAEGLDAEADSKVERQRPLSAFTIGTAGRLGNEGWLGRIAAGLGLLAPTRTIIGFEAESGPGNPSFFRYGARQDKISVLPAAAIRLLPWAEDDPDAMRVSLGAGATILADLNGEVIFNLDAAATTAARTDFAIEYDIAPNVGLMVWPFPWLSFGVAYRGELSLKVDLAIVVDLDGDGTSEFPLSFEAVTLFQPQQLQAGFAVDPFDALTLSFDVTWYNWSAFEDPFLTIEPVLAQIDPDADDTFVPRVGVLYRATDAVTLRAGYFYEPSPFPEQDGPTNLVDPDRHVFSLGAGYVHWTTRERFVREGDAISAVQEPWDPFAVDVFFQLHVFDDLKVDKLDPAQSGGAGASFDAGGIIWNAGIFFTIRV